jgi:hypothetical protein
MNEHNGRIANSRCDIVPIECGVRFSEPPSQLQGGASPCPCSSSGARRYRRTEPELKSRSNNQQRASSRFVGRLAIPFN